MFEEIMRQQLIVQRLEGLITLAAKVPPLEVQQMFNALHERVTLDYVEIEAASFKEPITVNDEDVQKFYDANQEAYRTSRQVKVRYVYVPIDEAAQQVSEADITTFYQRSAARFGTNALESVKEEIRQELVRNRALAQAGDRATELTVKLVPEPGSPRPDFVAAAAAAGLAVKETGFFGLEDPVEGITADRTFNQRALLLRTDNPVSDPVEGENGYYIMDLVETKPSVIPPLADVKDKVVAALKEQRALEATHRQGGELATKLKAAVAAGKAFADAAQEQQLAVKTSEPFNMTEPTPKLPAGPQVHELALGLRVGAVSDFVPTATGGLIFAVKDRTEPTAEEFEKQRAQMQQVLLRQTREAVWQAWLSELWRNEQVSL
jgi:peptidyl-prolyl cis-trans isomerase D